MNSLTLCSPVCNLDCCHLLGSKLLGWNTEYTDPPDCLALHEEGQHNYIGLNCVMYFVTINTGVNC